MGDRDTFVHGEREREGEMQYIDFCLYFIYRIINEI